MKNSFKETITIKNLESAFAGESMANRKYLYFAKIARELGDEEVAKVFEETAHQETGHAFSHLQLLYPAETLTVEKLLELAIAGERYEHTIMYPGFEKTAIDEGQINARAEFKEQGQESKMHDEMFTAILEKARKKFHALTKVEKIHADRYQSLLNSKKGAK